MSQPSPLRPKARGNFTRLRQRLAFLFLLIAFTTVTICTKLLVFGLNHAAIVTIKSADALRGDIVDRNGEILARSVDSVSIGIHPHKLLTPSRELAAKLAAIMPDKSADDYLTLLHSKQNFVYIHKQASAELVRAVNMLGEPAIDYIHEPSRLYPQGALAVHAIGYVNQESEGVAGIERAFDDDLAQAKKPSHALTLSLDSRVQAVLENELSTAMLKHKAQGAAAIVMDVNNGEVIAFASLPNFDPNKSGQALDEQRRNRATQSVYELGSTFKPLAFAHALETGAIPNLSTRFDTVHPIKIGDYTIHDDQPSTHRLNAPEALVASSNIFTARIDEAMGKEEEMRLFNSLGFNHDAQIELKELGHPKWPDYWARSSVMTVGYGHGISITLLHLASAYAALVNGGLWHPPSLLKRPEAAVFESRRVFAESTSLTMRKMLRLVVMRGTGERADVPGLRVGGKTGTAEIASKDSKGYSKSAVISSFASAFPMDKPRYVVLTLLERPLGTKDTNGAHTAAYVAAPIAGHIISRIAPLLSLAPDTHKDIELSDMLALLPPARAK